MIQMMENNLVKVENPEPTLRESKVDLSIGGRENINVDYVDETRHNIDCLKDCNNIVDNKESNYLPKETTDEGQEALEGNTNVNNKESGVIEITKSCNTVKEFEDYAEQEASEFQKSHVSKTKSYIQNTKSNNHVSKRKFMPDSVKIHYNKSLSETNLIEESKTVVQFSPKWKQFMAAMGPILMILCGGLSSGYSSTLLPHLKEEKSVIIIDNDSPSWIASIAALPLAPSCLAGSWLMEKFGRRYCLRCICIPFLVGWILISSAQTLQMMLIGRFLNGVSIGLLAPVMSVFISETSSAELRGMFLAFLSFSFAVGIFVSHILGTWLPWQWTAIICALFPILSALLLTVLPESPVWLLSKGKNEDAVKSYFWLRGFSDSAKKELQALLNKFKSVESTSISWREKLQSLLTPELFKPLIIMIVINVTCQFSGVHTITFYSVDIIEHAVGRGIDRYSAMLTIDTLRVITSLVTCLKSKKCPRRILCIISGILTTLSMLGLSSFLYFFDGIIPSQLSFLPLSFLSAFIIAINIGLMPLAWIIVGEIFPARFRSFGAGIASAVGYASIFIIIKFSPRMISEFGQVCIFTFYGCVALVGTCILFILLPETKGKTLLEIETLFKEGKIDNVT